MILAKNLNISVMSIESGFGPDQLLIGVEKTFRLLTKPSIAIMSHQNFNSYDVGVSWWSLDHHLGIRHSQLNSA